MPTRSWLGRPADHAANIVAAFKWLAENTSPGHTALLVVHQLSNADSQSIIGGVIGAQAAKALQAGRLVAIGGGDLQLVTLKRPPSLGWLGGPVLVAWAAQDLLDFADTLGRATAILAVSWHDDTDLQHWIRTWNVPKLGEPPASRKSLVSNYVVENALYDVVGSINVADGGTHPSDQATIVQTFQILTRAGEAFSPDEVRAWLIAEGHMHPRHADAIKTIAAKIRDGRVVRVRDRLPHWRDDIIDFWRRRKT